MHHPGMLGREAVPWLVPAASAQALCSMALSPLEAGMCEQEAGGFCPPLGQFSVSSFSVCPPALGVMILRALIGLN